MRTLLLVFPALLPLFACSSAPARVEQEQETYVLAILCTGDMAAYKSVEERRDLQAGHMANINRLAQARQLLVAGPFARKNPRPEWRGIFVFDVRTEAEAKALAASDPSVQAGLFRIETYPLTTDADLRGALELHYAQEQARQATGATDPMGGMRAYAVLVAHDGARALELLAGRREVFLAGELGGAWQGRALFLLDAKDLASAQALLAPLQAQLGPHDLLPWFGAATLARPGDES